VLDQKVAISLKCVNIEEKLLWMAYITPLFATSAVNNKEDKKNTHTI